MSKQKVATEPLRTQIAANFVKHAFLENEHIGGVPQWHKISKCLDRHLPSNREGISQSTWESWIFGKSSPRPQTCSLMDDILWNSYRDELSTEENSLRSDPRRRLFSRIVEGEPIDIELPYPAGNLFLHLRGLDAALWNTRRKGRNGDLDRYDRANEVLVRLHNAWNPQNGWIYECFRSDAKIQYDRADILERTQMREQSGHFQPNLLDCMMRISPRPSKDFYSSYSNLNSFSVIPFLFSLHEDREFLIEERLTAWAVDLATATAALRAIWTSQREKVANLLNPGEELYWLEGLAELFWSSDFDFETVLFRLNLLKIAGQEEIFKLWHATLLLARRAYHNFLRIYGISYKKIGALFEHDDEDLYADQEEVEIQTEMK